MANKSQMVEALKHVVSSHCKVCKGMGFSTHELVHCPCDEKLRCEDAIAFLRGSDSKAIVFGTNASGYEEDAIAIRTYAVEHGMRPADVVFHATAKYMEETP